MDELTLDPDPFVVFKQWYESAEKSGQEKPDAMALATCGTAEQPDVRVVLFKGWDGERLIFFTNYDSKKGKQIRRNSKGALCFYWARVNRQIRIRGNIEKTSLVASETYAKNRPRPSQISAWASPQSQVVESRDFLVESYNNIEKQFEAKDKIPCPPFGGGMAFVPNAFEFWENRDNRLHERFEYVKKQGKWLVQRLAP